MSKADDEIVSRLMAALDPDWKVDRTNNDPGEITNAYALRRDLKSSDRAEVPEPDDLPDDLYDYLKEKTIDGSNQNLLDYIVEKAQSLKPGDQEVLESFLHIGYEGAKRAELEEDLAELMITGTRLIDHLRINEDILRGPLLMELPPYTITPDGKLEPMGRIPHRQGPMSSSYDWWFMRRDIAFYKSLHPDIYGASKKNPFISPRLVADSLRISTDQLQELVIKHSSRVFRLDSKRGTIPADAAYLKQNGLSSTRFDSADLKKLESLYKRDLASTETKVTKVQNYAKQKWGPLSLDRRPGLSEMARKAKKHFQGQLYKNTKDGKKVDLSISTYRGYIRPLGLHDPH